MAILDDESGTAVPDGPRRGPGLPAVIGGAALLLVLAWWLWPASAPVAPTEEAPKPAAAVKPAAPSAPAPVAPEPEAPKPTRRATPKPAAPLEVAPEPAAPAAPAFALHVETDLPGASVFIDRKYLGVSPLTTSEVTPGTHQLNVSIEGQEGVAQTIDVADSGTTTVTVRFRDVRLDASVGVVHKHAMGSCEGRLVGSPAGLRYETSNKGDAFTMAFREIEVFEIDYLAKALKVKKRGGKTWNFTTKSATADPLFVFHRDVEKARQKLAGSL
jgi:hypothetical protein